MPELPAAVTVSKLEAARRQLATAIELWFRDKDQVSIHALAYAAYEVVHAISKKQGRTQTLIFDAIAVPERFRRVFAAHVKKGANFFKHADHDPNGTIELQPVLAEIFFIFSILGLRSVDIPANEYESAFLWWFHLNRPDLLTQKGRELFTKFAPVDALNEVRSWPKSEFFDVFLQARSSLGTTSI
ncbi:MULTISPECIES: hypothetical protein [Acidobacteriaceae]|uniref:hypothetical protein n=1 Tax=Acidobacteriaceae TaxID=204434 RepID=UPI00131AC620|nr:MULTISPECIES: hypothetical protein [Acidobacteriaceae]MDW5264442.1 hypothetical protein [Edaphobacter sp.]